MVLTDRVLGLLVLSLSVALITYYITWTVFTPLLEESHEIQSLFPDRKFALIVPAVLLVLVFSVAGTFVGLVMMAEGKGKQS